MDSLLKKFFHWCFVLLACLHLAGGPYAFVQTYAWGKMLTEYSKESGFIQGAKETFSGERPCDLCRKIEKAKASESNQTKDELPAAPASKAKLVQEMLWPGEKQLIAPVGREIPAMVFHGVTRMGEVLAFAPPTPPPRAAA